MERYGLEKAIADGEGEGVSFVVCVTKGEEGERTVRFVGGGLADAARGDFPVFHLEEGVLALKLSLRDECSRRCFAGRRGGCGRRLHACRSSERERTGGLRRMTSPPGERSLGGMGHFGLFGLWGKLGCWLSLGKAVVMLHFQKRAVGFLASKEAIGATWVPPLAL